MVSIAVYVRGLAVLPYVFLTAGLLAIGLAMWWPGFRLRRAMAQQFSPEWERILIVNLPPYRRMPVKWRQRLQQLIKRFLHEKQFVGNGGLEINDEMRVTIAGAACLLVLNRASTVYQALRFIYVYPDSFHAPVQHHDESGVVSNGYASRSGESWSNGKVILSWNDILIGTRNFTDGNNVALHEFAHQLDQESGSTNGAPLLDRNSAYTRWAEVFTQEYRDLVNDARFGRQSLMDHYGATNPAEFFAVATETFFEQPKTMSDKHPELFQQLSNYYKIDPRTWHD